MDDCHPRRLDKRAERDQSEEELGPFRKRESDNRQPPRCTNRDTVPLGDAGRSVQRCNASHWSFAMTFVTTTLMAMRAPTDGRHATVR